MTMNNLGISLQKYSRTIANLEGSLTFYDLQLKEEHLQLWRKCWTIWKGNLSHVAENFLLRNTEIQNISYYVLEKNDDDIPINFQACKQLAYYQGLEQRKYFRSRSSLIIKCLME